MRNQTTIANELIASGLAPAQQALLMELIFAMSTGLSGRNPVESPEYRALEKRRAWDRDRQKKRREAERIAKDASAKSTGQPPESTGLSGGNADDRPTLEEKKEGLSIKKESKKGSRLLSGARVSDENRAIAIENGCPPDRVDAVWAEFVDYWSDIPGQKGCKLTWIGTWRNWVKRLFGKGNNGNGPSNHRPDSAAGRATTREAHSVAAMGGAALRYLQESKAAGSGRGTSGGASPAGEFDLGKRAENAR